MLFQPSNISPDEVNGSGTIDITEDMNISWQVSGDSAMTAYKIDIYKNDAASTLLYSTGKVSLQTPFWGTDYKGDVQYFSVTLDSASLEAAELENGNEYKFLITQWWGTNDSIQQQTASLFLTRATPTLAINTIPNPVTEKEYSFTGVYSQAQGDTIRWVRWEIATADNTDEPFLDTGEIHTGVLRVDYDGFYTGNQYKIRLTVETNNGIKVSTGWKSFTVSYTVGESTGTVTACLLAAESCVSVSWTSVQNAQGYSVLRLAEGSTVLEKIADVEATTGNIRDYSARSGSTYTYYVFPIGSLVYLTEPMISNPVAVKYTFWSIIRARFNTTSKQYEIEKLYRFRYGTGGINVGGMNNNNSPNISRNFTRYPTRQADSANYLSGAVSAFVGNIDQNRAYRDTAAEVDEIMALSTSDDPLFLQDPKGRFLRIHTSEAIQVATDTKKEPMPQTLTFPWVEVDDAKSIQVISSPGGELFPNDIVGYTDIRIDPQTGALLWTIPSDYTYGSQLSLNGAGSLIQSFDDTFIPADMELYASTGILSATVE